MVDPGKADLRSRMRTLLKGLDPGRRITDSECIARRIQALACWRRARVVLLYAPLPDEPELGSLIHDALATGRQVALPVFLPDRGVYGIRGILDPGEDLMIGRHGVREPGPKCPELAPEAVDLAVVPGLAFTPDGWRLGRGGGYYDRLLAALGAVRCGVARDEQMLDRLPVETHDVRLDVVVTPSATHWCRRQPG